MHRLIGITLLAGFGIAPLAAQTRSDTLRLTLDAAV